MQVLEYTIRIDPPAVVVSEWVDADMDTLRMVFYSEYFVNPRVMEALMKAAESIMNNAMLLCKKGLEHGSAKP